MSDTQFRTSKNTQDAENLLPMLQAIQKQNSYLPELELVKLSKSSGVSLAHITSLASFFSGFRFTPAGRYEIKVCIGAACHVKGAEAVYQAFKRHLNLQNSDTDEKKLFTLSKVSCLGCCMMAPAVLIDNKMFGWVDPKEVSDILETFLRTSESGALDDIKISDEYDAEIRICLCSSCEAGGAGAVFKQIQKEIKKHSYQVNLKQVGCTGMSYRTPFFQIISKSGLVYDYGGVKPHQLSQIMLAHLSPKGVFGIARSGFSNLVDKIYSSKECLNCAKDELDSINFSGPQLRIATEYAGQITPLDFEDYLKHSGFLALQKISSLTLEAVISELTLSGLRGRGGGGFPTGKKWEIFSKSRNDKKFIICNADEGDPGAFMDRMLLESFPFKVLEGMMIAAQTLSANRGIIYIREEYQRAIKILKFALQTLHEKKLLPMQNGFNISIFEGAGAFVCGEETSLIASVEGRRPEPTLRPPFPVESGLFGSPTLINNVETFANIPWIILNGAQKFKEASADSLGGTKTFALAGKIQRGGLIEVPLGISIRKVLEDIGGGAIQGRSLKAVQIGGPSGGCIPERLFDSQIDYDSLSKTGAIMGSGGLVVLDDKDCMVDIAAYFLRFIKSESCGKCAACRVGSAKMLFIIDKIREGRGKLSDLDEIENLGRYMKSASLCGLGKTAPNPVLTAIKYFKEEFIEHINGRCPTGKCRSLANYTINDNCIGCTKCAQECASEAIEFTPFEKHKIDPSKCVRCGVCIDICPMDAVEVK